jgi:hypothetical protein
MRRVGLTLAALALGALGACGVSGGSAASPSPDVSGGNAMSIPAERFRLNGTTVVLPLTLEVSGDGDADITYAPVLGKPSTRITAATPWTKTLEVSSGDPLVGMLTARTSSTSQNATITCRIKIAEALVEAKTAHGPHALAKCSTMTEITQTP